MTNLQTTCFTDEELALHALEEYLEEGEDRDEMEAFIEEHAQELLEELLEDGHDKDEMKGFIEIFGSKAFYENYEDYLRMIDQYDQETVDAFLNADFDIDDISRLEDAYYGQYDSEEEFAENFVTECYGMPDMPSWIAIDWKETWEDGLSWDYTFYNGFVFCNHF